MRWIKSAFLPLFSILILSGTVRHSLTPNLNIFALWWNLHRWGISRSWYKNASKKQKDSLSLRSGSLGCRYWLAWSTCILWTLYIGTSNLLTSFLGLRMSSRSGIWMSRRSWLMDWRILKQGHRIMLVRRYGITKLMGLIAMCGHLDASCMNYAASSLHLGARAWMNSSRRCKVGSMIASPSVTPLC